MIVGAVSAMGGNRTIATGPEILPSNSLHGAPAPHVCGVTAPNGQYWPAGHKAQTLGKNEIMNCPRGQPAAHADAPAAEKKPSGHAVHEPWLVTAYVLFGHTNGTAAPVGQ
jgi:hypothetical protein